MSEEKRCPRKEMDCKKRCPRKEMDCKSKCPKKEMDCKSKCPRKEGCSKGGSDRYSRTPFLGIRGRYARTPFIHHHSHAKLGQPVPILKMDGIDKDSKEISWNIHDNFVNKKWTVLLFWPADFTPVCATEIKALSKLAKEFHDSDADIVGVSVDSPYVHKAWVKDVIGKVNFPLLSDQTHQVSKYFGVYNKETGRAERGTFIICRSGYLWAEYSTIKSSSRDVAEVLRLLKSCQAAASGKMMPCGWQPGEPTIKVS